MCGLFELINNRRVGASGTRVMVPAGHRPCSTATHLWPSLAVISKAPRFTGGSSPASTGQDRFQATRSAQRLASFSIGACLQCASATKLIKFFDLNI